MSLTYEQSGVNYDTLDAFKRACQRAASTTTGALASHGLREPASVRGESAYLLETPDEYLAHVEEGLGTKNLVADAMWQLARGRFYRNMGIDTVATMVNDLITCGALPISVAMHAAVGDAKWFEHSQRNADLAEGFAQGCIDAGAVWGGGETPALKGIVNPDAIVLAGSAVGRIRPKSLRIQGDVRDGDAIIMLASNGVHTNGLTLCRALADRLPEGYLTPVADGRTYGEALCDPSIIYVNFVRQCQEQHIALHYAAHITGHGWRKLMRLDTPFVHRITTLPKVPPIFQFLQHHGPIDLREAYGTFNMGAGFAVWVDPKEASAILQIAKAGGYDALLAGHAIKQGDRKCVEIVPLGLTYEAETLQVR